MSVRAWHVDQALSSVSSLNRVLAQLTEHEILHCLELEAATQRRKSVINRLISRAARMRELTYVRHLKEKFHGTFPVQDPQRS